MTSTEQNMTSPEQNIDALNATTILISENNKLIEKMITKLNNDLLHKIENLSNPALIVPKTRRTRTITPVSDYDRCTQILVSGKNKGSKCSKKATALTLCTMHNKKMAPCKVSEENMQNALIQIIKLSDEYKQALSSDEPVSDEPVSDEPVSDEPVSDEPVSDE
jgi:hypothetical protein